MSGQGKMLCRRCDARKVKRTAHRIVNGVPLCEECFRETPIAKRLGYNSASTK